jgi:hypothetical protein
MAFTRTVQGAYREVWVQDTAFDGGASNTLVTAINPRRTAPGGNELDYVEVYLYVDSVVGIPIIPDPVPSIDPATGNVRVFYQNTAAAGNSATFTLDIRLNQSHVR